MFPVQLAFLLPGVRPDPSVGLVFYVEELGAVEPVSGSVGEGVTTDGLCKRFPHHSGRIPDSFNGGTVPGWDPVLGAIPDRKNMVMIRTKKLVNQDAFIGLDPGIL